MENSQEADSSELVITEEECSVLFKKIKSLERALDQAKQEFAKTSSRLKQLKRSKLDQENKIKIESLNRNLSAEWIDCQFPWSEKLKLLLKKKFNFESFRPKQLAAINATLSKKDVLLVMPTGGGKSLVYQLPALVDEGFSLIISPLISLIEDQLIALKKLGIHGATVHASTAKSETKLIYEQMIEKKSDLKLLYVTPEWVAKSKRFLSQLKKCYEANRIARVAIDEVHCCSTWGHDFRPDYNFLGILRPMLAKVPFLGLTATATMTVLTDVQAMLKLEGCMVITAPFNRPNLFYKVLLKQPIKGPQIVENLTRLLQEDYKDQTGIIYTNTVSDSVSLTQQLREKGLKVAPYHAQLEPEQKKKIHNRWLRKEYQVVVATVAFGMGIDKPDVRFVIHYTIPKSMESLYQESGRAGRDGNGADCIVLFNLRDYFKVSGMASSVLDEKKALQALEYCLDEKSCRRAIIATHFEEVWDSSHCKKMCDHCSTDKQDFVYYDITSACRDIHSLIELGLSNDEKLTLNKLIDGWFHTGAKTLRLANSSVPKISKEQGETIIAFLLLRKYLEIDKGYNTYSTICYITKGKDIWDNDKIEMLYSKKLLGFPKRYPSQHRCENDVFTPAKKLKTK